jgi:phosphoenolpyruvate carboxykinase (ATP)
LDRLYGVNRDKLHENLSVSELINEAVRRGDGMLAANGALLMDSGRYTGRSPKDRFIVCDEITKDTVSWGDNAKPLEPSVYAALKEKVLDHIADREMYWVKARVGADANHGLRINVLAENAGQALFASQIFIKDRERDEEADFTVIAVPSFKAEGEEDGVRSEAFIVINMKEKLILIAGSYYSGEIKKSVFTVMNYLLPEKGILPMHCSANMDNAGHTALFFGLSGTGKTTLSADASRKLIGDDEHGWSNDGVFNFEGGCYAKTINLHPEKEKEIFEALRFGSLLENVMVDDDGVPDYYDGSRTENTRGTYPIEYIPNHEPTGKGGQPQTVIFLTADAFGALPPISRLSKEAAMYHFMSGYTSKLAGTERGITDPETTFSALFGEPFMIRPIEEYAQLLGRKMEENETEVYLVNTGWIGGRYGVGDRIPLVLTRRMVTAALRGELKEAEYRHDPIFNLEVPVSIDGVPDALLHPKIQWEDAKEYEKTAKELAAEFRENFKRFENVDPAIVKAGPPA